jgi:biopolymer transport protein ExbD
MNNINRRRLTASPEINVTPLIDVLLVLLIIFMVISPAIASKFSAKLPEKLERDKISEYPMLVVTVTSSGDYLLNLDRVPTLEDLQGFLLRTLERRPPEGKAVFIKAPRSARYGEIVKVIDVMKAAGSAPIGLQIEDLER